MAWGEGADWEINPVDVGSGTASFLLKVSSPAQPPATQEASVVMHITQDDTPVTAAMKLAQEWNTQACTEGVVAVAEEGQSVTAFFLTGDLASWRIAEMAITFPDQVMRVMNLNETVKWDKGHLQVTRVLVDVSWPAQSG